MVAGSFKLWGGVERCHTVLPPFLYRHALLAVVVVLLRLLRLGATIHFGSSSVLGLPGRRVPSSSHT